MNTRYALCLSWLFAIVGVNDAQSQTRAFTGATLIDGTDRAPVRNATILVRDGRIVAAGAAQSIAIPQGAERVALDGKTVIPGLINAHGHVTDVRNLRSYAVHGVTTIYSLGDEPDAVFAARASQATPALSTSRVFVAGPVLAPTSAERSMSSRFVSTTTSAPRRRCLRTCIAR
jgi:hypothetical protein